MSMIEKLEGLMKERGLNKAELARQAGIPYTTVDGFWKRGTDNVQRSSLMKLSRFFDCALDYLADDCIKADDEVFKKRSLFLQSAESYSPHERQLIEKYRALDGRGKKVVDMLIDSQLSTIDKDEVV